uniref:Pentatricopeptide repeat-containing protein At1g73400-like n=2 Tax=Rhizophora mucronata TaxID=61149 RepID=A0A2P2ISI6_RHIMU
MMVRRLCACLYAVRRHHHSSSSSATSFFNAIIINTNYRNAVLPSFSRTWKIVPHPHCYPLNLSISLNVIQKTNIGVAMHPYCSQIASLEEPHGGRGRIRVKESEVDRLYETVMGNHNHDMEDALDQLGLELTTDLVLEVLDRLRFEEKIAFRFFTWAARQQNYAHEPIAYNEMIDILSSSKYKMKQFRIVCDMLDHMKRSDKNVVPLEVLLTILKNYTQKYLTRVQLFAKKKRIRVKTQPEINAFNLLLDALCKCSLVEDAEALFTRIKSKIKPDSNTYNILFFGWCRVKNPNRGMRVLEEMIQLGHTPDAFTYTTAIDAFCKAGKLTEAVELLEFMRTKGSTMSSPTAKTYTIMISALAQNDRMDECFKFLGHMLNSGCLPDVSTYKELIEGMCSAGKTDEAYRLLQEMGNKGYPPDIVTYNCFLKVLCEAKNSDEALRLYKKMSDVGCLPSVQTYNMLMSMFFAMDDPDGALESWHEMEHRGCAQDVDSYCVMIDGLFGCNRVEDACFLIDDVVNKGLKLPYQKFDSFLMQLSVTGDLQAIHKLSEHMRKFYNPFMARRHALNQKRRSMSFRGK